MILINEWIQYDKNTLNILSDKGIVVAKLTEYITNYKALNIYYSLDGEYYNGWSKVFTLNKHKDILKEAQKILINEGFILVNKDQVNFA